ncbi:MAG: amidohydrolase, partial [Actinomycetota bacterium]
MARSKAELKALVQEEIDRRAEDIVRVSAAIQAHPETGFFEHRTADVVAQELRGMGLSVETQLARTGVKATMRGHADGPTVGILGELDSLIVPDS